MKYTLILGSLLASCLLTGCGNDWHAETYPATGKITVNGAAASGAVVTLHAVNRKVDVRNSRPYGIADEQGNFSLKTYEADDGAPVGEYDVTVTWPVDVTKMDLAMIDQLDGKFDRPTESQWKVNITEGDNAIASIDITGVTLKQKRQGSRSRSLPRGPEQGSEK
ncbi:hypothetical protein NHH03_13890 [Stieleria sp. TO1_6]|uniref:hypothetical protein n=1 Tax=Stieleria tagensis TaxID=2956795 RepID=UPI00209B5421|nr:hypothetical protein [Stieleria tagensis]MCO8122835.1 hypothetical protein [Stieleria tagensis]